MRVLKYMQGELTVMVFMYLQGVDVGYNVFMFLQGVDATDRSW